MDLCNINEIKELLLRHGFHFSKAKGQNFLTQSWVPHQIAACSALDRQTGVLEVGPGIGCLTAELCNSAGKVVAVELDTSLKPLLQETMSGKNNLEIVFGDILRQNIPQLVTEKLPVMRPVACANLPYYITSPVIAALLESRVFDTVTVMVQKEVADRICAAPGTPDYSAFSVFCQYYSIPEKQFEVPASCFIPQPKVTSAVLKMKIRQEPVCYIQSEALFFKVVKATFNARRKTLLNGLSMGFPGFDKGILCSALGAAGIAPAIRGEKLSIPEFALLANEMAKRGIR